MGSTMSLSQAKKPEIVSNLPKVTFDDKEAPTDKDDKVVASQPVKRRSG